MKIMVRPAEPSVSSQVAGDTGDSAGKIKEQQRMVACSPSLVACSTMLNVIVCVL